MLPDQNAYVGLYAWKKMGTL